MRNRRSDEYGKQYTSIDELRESEKRYRFFFENANDLIQVVDTDGRFLFVNNLWSETLGYSLDEARAMRIFDIIDGGCRKNCRTIFDNLMKGEKLPPVETVFVARDGRKLHVEGRCTPRYIDDDQPAELLGIFRDVTERNRLEKERERLISELKDALAQVRTLEGFLPICASCKKIRDDKGYWNQIENYIKDHSLVQFSHGICPECMTELYPEVTLKGKTGTGPIHSD